MLFALICTDRPDSVELRMKVRPDHLNYLESLGAALKAAGPFTSADGRPTGSLVIVEAPDEEAARRIAAADPYAAAGLFAAVDVRAWKWLIKNPEAR